MKKELKITALMLALILAFCGGGFGAFAETADIAEPEPAESAEPAPYLPMFYLPGNMRGIIISPEVDFITSPDDGVFEVTLQLDGIFEYILDLGLNTVIIKTSSPDKVYYDLDMNRSGRADFIKLAVERAMSYHLNAYLIYDIGYAVNSESFTSIDALVTDIHKFTIKYSASGIIIDNYYNNPEINDFSRYMRSGTGIGYENWLYDSTEYLFETAGAVIRTTNNSVPVGVMINDMWANASSLEGGSETNDSVEAFFDGFSDTKKYIENNYVDFIMLRCYGSLTDVNLPFEESARWWGELCEASGLPMYLIHHNEKMGDGWGEDQLLRQLKTAKESVPAYGGSVFNSFTSLWENRLDSAGTLKKYYADLIDEEHLMRELVMTSPRNFNFTTFEPTVDFMGTFDRNFDVYFNDRRVVLNEAGNFFYEEPLSIGLNTFTIRHKERTYVYRIERKIIVMREIDASIASGKVLRVEGETRIMLEATAYKGASVIATVNDRSVRLEEQAGTLLDDDINSAYTRFTASYQVPAGIIGVEQPLGQLSVQATYMGYTENMQGAAIIVNAKPAPPPPVNFNPVMFDESSLGSGEIAGTIGAVRDESESVTFVKVNGDNTHVFDAKTTGMAFDPRFGQLPAGTLDYYRASVGEFYSTESGKRFRASDVTLIDGAGIGENALTVLESGTYRGDSYFEIALDAKISYNVEVVGLSFSANWGNDYYLRSFDAEYVYITFDNVTSVTKLPSFEANLVFSSGTWEQVTTADGAVKFRLILRLRHRGVYAGNSAYYNADGNLMLTFPVLTNSFAGMTIVIDPGHGYGTSAAILDPGAIGHITEFTANLAIAKSLETKLISLGANVIRLRTEETYIPTITRPVIAREYGCDLFISIHANKAVGNSEARGTEVFYYTPFSQPLASAISQSVASYFTNNVYSDGADKNRGAKSSYFWVTVEQGFPSVLVETGFVSNLEDAMAMANPIHQDGIAQAIVSGIQSYLSRSPISYSPDGSIVIPDRHAAETPPESVVPDVPDTPDASEPFDFNGWF